MSNELHSCLKCMSNEFHWYLNLISSCSKLITEGWKDDTSKEFMLKAYSREMDYDREREDFSSIHNDPRV